jgi:hypothetical protein
VPAVAKRSNQHHQDLPADNAARLALFDAIAEAEKVRTSRDGLSDDELFVAVIGRLRVLVPRELHVQGERDYVAEKVNACLEQGILRRDARGRLRRGIETPQVRYPDGSTRDYTPGLEAARERLKADESRLHSGNFDVRRIVRKSDSFKSLVAFIQEHGFVDLPPVTKSRSGQIIDGFARSAAAAKAGVPEKSETLPAHRDTPLQHVRLVLDANAHRLEEKDRLRVWEAVEARTCRPWQETSRDLELTQDWRRTVPKEYGAKLDVKLVRFANQEEPKVQITTDGTRIGLTSLTRQAGLAPWSRDHIEPYVVIEEARTTHSMGGKKPWFVNIADLIAGIEKMQRESELKIDPRWADVRKWLIETFQSPAPPESHRDEPDAPAAPHDDPVLPGLG